MKQTILHLQHAAQHGNLGGFPGDVDSDVTNISASEIFEIDGLNNLAPAVRSLPRGTDSPGVLRLVRLDVRKSGHVAFFQPSMMANRTRRLLGLTLQQALNFGDLDLCYIAAAITTAICPCNRALSTL